MLDFKSMTLSCTKMRMNWKETLNILQVFDYCSYGNNHMSHGIFFIENVKTFNVIYQYKTLHLFSESSIQQFTVIK